MEMSTLEEDVKDRHCVQCIRDELQSSVLSVVLALNSFIGRSGTAGHT